MSVLLVNDELDATVLLVALVGVVFADGLVFADSLAAQFLRDATVLKGKRSPTDYSQKPAAIDTDIDWLQYRTANP